MGEDLGFHIPMGPWCESANERVAELEVERDALKCCGNCSFWLSRLDDCPIKDEPYADRFDSCHFTPPRWTAYAEEGSGDE